ncbi:MAG: sodium/glutamate symporter [Actinomycetota bacterium]|jgi:ESS family glutamate:Na+ symporter|nr:sodium/glutamate symporter [Actinomycetota bacterium]
MEEFWYSVKDFLFLSLFLLVAIVLKNKIKFFQRFLVPTAIIGGFIGLILGKDVLNWIVLDTDFLGKLIYHLMAIGFIALALKDREYKFKEDRKDNINTGFAIISIYLIQGIVGFAISLFIFYAFMPNLFPPFGLLLPLSFAQGPGQAYSIGKSWELIGFTNGANIGLSFSTIGFLWAVFFGIPLMNYLIRNKKKLKLEGLEKEAPEKHDPEKEIEEKHTETIPRKIFIDSLSIQIVLIGIIYLITFFSLKGISIALKPMGDYGETVSQLLWGFHFVIATLITIIVRIILNFLKRKNWLHINYPDNYMLQRISSSSFDYMIVASIASISIVTFRENWIPILIITTVGGVLTIFYTFFLCRRIFKSYKIEHIVAFYGTWTGTISTGMALLNEIDPEAKSNTAENYVLGSAIALPLGVPLMFILGLAVNGYKTNNQLQYLYTQIIFIAFFLILLGLMLWRKRQISKNKV